MIRNHHEEVSLGLRICICKVLIHTMTRPSAKTPTRNIKFGRSRVAAQSQKLQMPESFVVKTTPLVTWLTLPQPAPALVAL